MPDRVARSIAAYRDVFAHYASWDWGQVREVAATFVDPIADYDPRYLEELKGIAEGAAADFLDVVAINVRTEIMFAAKARDASVRLPTAAECTSFAAVGGATAPVLVGQTWDWLVHAFDTVVVLESQGDDGPGYVTVVEAGLLAKAGFNSAGVGVVTNALVCSDDVGAPGVPYHVLLRALLDAPDPTSALVALQRAERSSSASFVIAHRDRLALGVEAMPGDFTRLLLSDPDPRGLVLHTNHFRHGRFDRDDVGIWVMPDSVFRFQRIDRALTAADLGSASTYEHLLCDHAGHPDGICAHPRPDDDPMESYATVFAAVFDLTNASLRLADGQPCRTGYRTLDYSDWIGG